MHGQRERLWRNVGHTSLPLLLTTWWEVRRKLRNYNIRSGEWWGQCWGKVVGRQFRQFNGFLVQFRFTFLIGMRPINKIWADRLLLTSSITWSADWPGSKGTEGWTLSPLTLEFWEFKVYGIWRRNKFFRGKSTCAASFPVPINHRVLRPGQYAYRSLPAHKSRAAIKNTSS